ncbi:response regulator [Opitutus sp. ER46]|uniref:response regulator n=1 Tax=Opitutus sp. ER46 TaxID=2161864 RepID=UPI000D30EA96|nr:response regulator [Opitutus sp. ER46]PTX91135.1 hypothetical protein DB354_21105 [Opitutus sp. ER46]
MDNPTQVLNVFLQFRGDALVFVLLAGIALVLFHRRTVLANLPLVAPRHTRFALMGLTIGAVLASELIAVFATGSSGWLVLGARLTLFVFTGLAIALLLRQALLVARFRRRMRMHFTHERIHRALRDSAEQASRAKSDFLVMISHEIRTPLSALISSAELLHKLPLAANEHAHVATILTEGHRLARAVNEVLDLRRIEEGSLVLECAPFSPADLVRDVSRLFQVSAEERGLQLRFGCDAPSGTLVSGDARRLRQILVNLVDNALKFTPRGEVALSVSVLPPDGRDAPAHLLVRVRDTGIGLTPEQQACLFTPAPPTPGRPESIPYGAGLLIVRRLIALMAGELTIHSRPHAGSEFVLSIPVRTVESPERRADENTAPAGDGRKRVLIVDDTSANRALLQMFIERLGHIADHAASGDEAVELAARTRYDAILMDLNMPGLDGLAATRRIRAAESGGRPTVIIAVTAMLEHGTRERCLAAGMNEHFEKPVDLRRLARTLNELMGVHPPASAQPVPAGDVSSASPFPSPPPQNGR